MNPATDILYFIILSFIQYQKLVSPISTTHLKGFAVLALEAFKNGHLDT